MDRREDNSTAPDDTPRSIHQYRLVRKLGEGGMGVVFEAIDERLRRTVALKLMRDATTDLDQRERLWREARVAAGLNHPNICQVFEVGEDDDRLFIAMEYLEGESLATRIARGSVGFSDALSIAIGTLSALGALHQRDIVHRDLKPPNIFLTEHGVKLLDFGVARSPGPSIDEELQITKPGTVVGTPRYMAPELWRDATEAGPAADVFAVGAILYEMLTGEPAFGGHTIPEVCHAILRDQPPPLTGGPEIVAVDRVIARALEKVPVDRYPDASVMLRVLRDLSPRPGVELISVRSIKRLMVLPFRVLRPDPEIDFLASSLPDAITASLAASPSIIVRSNAGVSAAATSGAIDLGAIAHQAGVDAVLHGTLLSARDQVRVTTQLVEAPSGTILSSRTSQARLDDIFVLQDRLSREIIESLMLDDNDPSGPLQKDVPQNPAAYAAYLRANHIAANMRLLPDARDLYLSSLNEDPHYAPAWARLGRVYRVMAKYSGDDSDRGYRRAEEAFQIAFEINPDLSLAHRLYTNLEVERGAALSALGRLLERVQRHPLDAELYASLVMACRFCGLLDASVAADRRARQLDPGVRTSVAYTFWMLGDYEQAMHHDDDDMRFVTHFSLPLLGREEEAIRRLRELEDRQPPGLVQQITILNRASIEHDRVACMGAIASMEGSGFRDPEGIYLSARCAARVGDEDGALRLLRKSVEGGFCCHETLVRDPWMESIRGSGIYRDLDGQSREQYLAALRVFNDLEGEALLGVESTS